MKTAAELDLRPRLTSKRFAAELAHALQRVRDLEQVLIAHQSNVDVAVGLPRPEEIS